MVEVVVGVVVLALVLAAAVALVMVHWANWEPLVVVGQTSRRQIAPDVIIIIIIIITHHIKADGKPGGGS